MLTHQMQCACPPTPKIHNGSKSKRSVDLLDCQSLQHSLKRMKVTSASPGELRLQRDFKHAVHSAGWIPAENCGNAWKVPATAGGGHGWMWVRQSLHDPLQLTVQYETVWTLWLDVPRLYPHRPPTVRRIVFHDHEGNEDPYRHGFQQIWLQSSPDDPLLQQMVQGVVMVRGWTPLLQLDEIIRVLLFPVMMGRVSEADCATEVSVSFQQHRQPTQQLPSPTTQHQEENSDSNNDVMRDADHYCLFPPNRFDVGYDRRVSRYCLDAVMQE